MVVIYILRIIFYIENKLYLIINVKIVFDRYWNEFELSWIYLYKKGF